MSWRAQEIAQFLARHPHAVEVRVAEALGSTPREKNTQMLVADEAFYGTIGGGQLEYLAIDHARRVLEGDSGEHELDLPLGPDIGQCCGGRVVLQFTVLTDEKAKALVAGVEAMEAAAPAVFVFGAGHVGRELARALAPLPFCVRVVDVRAAQLAGLPDKVRAIASPMPEAEVRAAPPGSAFVAVTHDHALDFLITREALMRADAGYVGMVGSRTKRAKFCAWARREGLPTGLGERLFCPIGGSSVDDKRPEIIAALTVAEIIGTMVRSKSQKHRRQPVNGAVREGNG